MGRRLRRLSVAALLAIGAVVVLAQASGNAQTPPPDALPYANGFLVTGNYVVGGVDLPRTGGIGTINFDAAHGNVVPADADIVGAYLYWETITRSADVVSGATFRGTPIQAAKVSTTTPLPGTGANCWGAAGGATSTLMMARADVLPLLPKRLDSNGQWTGKYIVNDADLVANSLPLHTITLPQEGTGNVLTQSAGASIVLVYRNPSEPLRKIVFYDGVYAQAQGTTMYQTIRGIYKSALTKSARITHIGGNGANNTGDRLFFNGSLVATDAFPAPIDSSSDRGWSNPTYPVSTLMPGSTTNDGYGETVTTSVDHGNANANSTPYECLTWAAVIFSTAVADAETGGGDGIPDGIEDASGGLKDPPTAYYPSGQPLPNLNQMGANSGQRDLFVEVNAMWAPAGTTYGSLNAPINSTAPGGSVTDDVGHNHLPKPEVFKSLGDTYLANGIHAHFDIGDQAAYFAKPGYSYVCPIGQSDCVSKYLVPSGYARGGEAIQERACVSNGTVDCQFPDYPGTVGWRLGVQLYQDAPVGDNGEELTTAQILETWGSGTQRRRVDRIRDDYFHYLLYSHARGKAKSPDPCLDAGGNPAGYNQTTPTHACVAPYTDNPLFHVPSSTSGVADLPGNVAMISLGLWDNFVGTTFIQTSTTLHELGHNLNLWHGGGAPIWGTAATPTLLQPNCKPNYLSSMSYLFQVHGLWDDSGNVFANYSGSAHNDIGETPSVSDGQLVPGASYQPSWYVPAGSPLALLLGGPPATRFCSGAKFDVSAPPPSMVRIRALSTSAAIDWNGDGTLGTSAQQDVNFDGTLEGTLTSYNDWASLRLDQIGAAKELRIFTSSSFGDYQDFGTGDFADSGTGDFADFGLGDFLDAGPGTYYVHFAGGVFNGDYIDFGTGDLTDFGTGDFADVGAGAFLSGTSGDLQDFGTGDLIDFGTGDILDFGTGDMSDFGTGDISDFGTGDILDFGTGDILDFGTGDISDFGTGAAQELDFDQAKELGRTAPSALNGCVLGTPCSGSQPPPFNAQYHSVRLAWKAPAVGQVSAFRVYRFFAGSAPNLSAVATAVQIAEVLGTQLTTTDNEELPNGQYFGYFVRAVFNDGPPGNQTVVGPVSNVTFVQVVNDAPVAVANSYSLLNGLPLLTVAAPGVLGNDTDDDTADRSLLRAVLVTTTPNGTLNLAPDGSFTYAPNATFVGTDSFTYKANDGRWINGALDLPMSPDSNTITVSITVQKKVKR